MTHYIDYKLDEGIIEAARNRLRHIRTIKRDRASNIDALVGMIGEMVFTQWLWGDWKLHHPTLNNGRVDIADRIEIKTSAHPMHNAKNMLCREEYLLKRSAEFYVQLILDTQSKSDELIVPGITCRLAGWTDHVTFSSAPLVTLTGKSGQRLQYQCYALPLERSKPMMDFPKSEFPRPARMSALKILTGGLR